MRFGFSLIMLVLLCWFPLAANAGSQEDLDEKLLQRTGVGTDNDTLLQFLRKRTGSEKLQKRILVLVEQLGHDRYAVRAKASQGLVAIGLPAVEQLVVAVKSSDLEVADRAGKCLAKIRSQAQPSVAAAVVRLLAKRKPTGTASVLLDYLPAADNSAIEEEIRSALPKLVIREGKIDPVFVTALQDKSPERRGAAAEALGLAGAKTQLDAVRKLLTDSNPSVRYRACLGMLAYKDRRSIPVLIALLKDMPLESAWRAEETLYRVAGEKAPSVALGATAESRTKCRQAWLRWWKTRGKKIDLAKYDPAGGLLGYTSMIVFGRGQKGHSIIEVDRAGNKRWEINNLNNPCDFRVIRGNKVLVAEYSGSIVTERTFDGKVVWSKKVSSPLSCQRLPNGNTFVGTPSGLYIFDRQGKQVSYIRKSRIRYARRFRNGNVAVMLSSRQFELLNPEGKVVRSFRVNLSIANTLGGVDFHPNGHVLVTQSNKIAEYDSTGKVVWHAKVSSVYPVAYTSKGTVLVASRNGPQFLELNKSRKQIWSHKVQGTPWIARRR